MLKTALKPRWILLLILAMAIASVFVLLSQWQFDSSRQAPPPAPSSTEEVRPLTDVLQPLTPLYATGADQMVSFDGAFLPDTRTLVQDRLRDGEDGFWVIQGFAVDGAATPGGEPAQGAVLPIVLGWVAAADDAASLPEQQGRAAVVGRLLPPEAPVVQRPVEGQVPSLATAELANRWDVRAYAAFVVATTVTAGGTDVPFAAGMEPVVVGPQPQETPINWLNIFYAIEWFVFAGFAFFLWWRLVADDHRRTLEDAEDAALATGDYPASGTRSEAGPAAHSAAHSEMTPETEGGTHRD
ncbi:SURF1 family protein [Arthrobacter pityocampae]|uniref:SURF1 family protein n=1 Tax=Arthrobacter pityocampae TaxID=547334 RepID=UPI001F4E7E5A|nr:SURF1 family protein [Arthrobacter pityocampae]